MGIFLALVAAVTLGIADFLALFSTKMLGTYRTLLYMQPLGLIGLSVYGMASGLLLKQGGSASWPAWTWAVGYVMLNLLATLAYYRSLQVGMVSIVSPIVASYAAVAVLLSVLTSERLSLSHGLGVGVTLVGVALTSTTFPQTAELIAHDSDQRRLDGRSRGVGVAIAAAVGYGVAFWLLGAQITPQLGPIAPVWLIRLLSPCILIACAAPLRQDLRMPRGTVWWFLAGVGLLDTLGYLAATNALATDHQIAIVGVLISLYSAVTILLAWIFLREHLQWSQWLGVGIIFGGIVLVTL